MPSQDMWRRPWKGTRPTSGICPAYAINILAYARHMPLGRFWYALLGPFPYMSNKFPNMCRSHTMVVHCGEGTSTHMIPTWHLTGSYSSRATNRIRDFDTRVTTWHVSGVTRALDINILHNTLSPCLMYTKIIFDMLGAHEVLGGVHGGGPP